MGGSGKHCLQDTDIKAAFFIIIIISTFEGQYVTVLVRTKRHSIIYLFIYWFYASTEILLGSCTKCIYCLPISYVQQANFRKILKDLKLGCWQWLA